MHQHTPSRAAIYYRVSGKEQLQGYSLEAQVRAIEAYGQQHHYAIVARYPEPARSARTDDEAKRPAFQQMLQDAEAGHFDVVIVHKMDRFARNRRVAFDAFHRLGKAGVGFVSVAENMDFSTPAGQLMLTMLVGMAQFYSDNLSFETKKGKGERKAQGLFNGLLPFGVTVNSEGVPVLDTDVHYCDIATRTEIVPANGLTLAFQLAAAGKSDREIAKALTNAGYRTSGNRGMNPFSKDTVRHMLQNRFYLGELPDGNGGWLPGKHGSLIAEVLFEKAEAARIANARQPRADGRLTRSRRSAGTGTPWALSGLAVCSCGSSIVVNSRPNGRRSLRCYGRTQGNGCDEPSFSEELLQEQLAALLTDFAVPVDEQERLVAAWRQRQMGNLDAAAAKTRLQHKLARLRELYLDDDLDKATYQAKKAALEAELVALPAGASQDQDTGQRLMGYLADLASAWSLATPEEQNKIARQLFAEAVIENRTVVAVKPRPELLPFFQSVNGCVGGSDGIRTRDLSLDRAAC
jgi:site-specific DNA recombinase